MDEATRRHSRSYHLADRVLLSADGRRCEMQELGELLCDGCWQDAASGDRCRWTKVDFFRFSFFCRDTAKIVGLRPPSSQSRKFPIVCGSQAAFVKLDEDGESLAFYCDDHVFEARR